MAGTLEIEGNFLGEEKITAILDGKRVLGSVKELAEVNGVIEVYESIENFNYTSMDDMFQAHSILMKDVLKNPSLFRDVNVGVGNHIAPPANQIPKLMKNLFSWLKNSDEHPLVVSSIFHYEFEFIHPFIDGNGRMGRFWQTLILNSYKKVFSNIAIESIIRDHQEKYYKAIEDSTQAGESTLFIEFMLEIILKAVESSVKSSVKSSVNTTDKIIEIIEKNPNITIKQISEMLELTSRAIEKQISILKKEKRLERIGSARKGYWKVLN